VQSVPLMHSKIVALVEHHPFHVVVQRRTRRTEGSLLARSLTQPDLTGGEFHVQADADWIVIRVPLRGHDDTPCGRPTPGQDWPPLGRIWCF
jgi:hypothetical protein